MRNFVDNFLGGGGGGSWVCTVNEHTAESFVITMVMEKAEKIFQAIMYYPQ